MREKEKLRNWNRFFSKQLKKGISWNEIRLALIVNHGIKSGLVESLIHNYKKEQAQRTKITTGFLVAFILIVLVLPFFFHRISITGMPIAEISGTTYYVDSIAGLDSNNGLSEDAPIKTLAKVNTLSLNPGDGVLFKRGSIWREAWKYSGNSGTAENQIIFGAYGVGDKPKFYGSINGSAPSYWTSLGNNRWTTPADFPIETFMIFYNTRDNVQLGARRTTDAALANNWDFLWSGSKIVVYHTSNPATVGNGIELPKYETTWQTLVYFSSVNYIVFRDVEISYTRYRGLEDHLGNHNEFRNIDFKYGYEKAVWLEGDNVIVDNNSFYLCGIRGQPIPYGLDAQGENMWITQNHNPTISNNRIEKCGGVCINLYHTDGGEVTGNRVWDCAQPANEWAAGIYYDGCNNSVTSYNNITDCQIGLQVGAENAGTSSHNITFHHNIAYNNAISEMLIDCTQSVIGNYNINISQNTFYKNRYITGSGFGNEIFLKYYRNVTFKDNIVYNNYPNSLGYLLLVYNGTLGSGLNSDYNAWNSSIGRNIWSMNWAKEYNSLTAWKNGQSQDSHSITNNPSFTDAANGDFTPQSGSPVCTMSSTGSYVGALPCVGSEPEPECGDGSCNGLENCTTCSSDCGSCPPEPFCGDLTCNGLENCTSCESDCGVCPPPPNNAPTHSAPVLNASDHPINSTDAILNCYNRSTADADGDPVTNTYRWFRNSSLVAGLAGSSVGAGNTSVGDSWMCEVRPYDGEDYGTARLSSALVILAACGDGSCNGLENCSTCESDCGECPPEPFCGDLSCNGLENCTTCSSDCGSCPLNLSLTACELEDYSWNEDENQTGVFNLGSCFHDGEGGELAFSSSGTSNISLNISSEGMVDLSAPADWNGVEYVLFSANIGNRTNSTNIVTLTVNAVADCGDSVCEAGEDCTSCSSDCGSCPVTKTSSGGGGGGSTVPAVEEESDWNCTEWTECLDGKQSQVCTHLTKDAKKTNTRSCSDKETISTKKDDTKVSDVVQVKEGTAEEPEVSESETKPAEEQTPGTIKAASKPDTLGTVIYGLLAAAILGAFVYGNMKNRRKTTPTGVDIDRALHNYVSEAAKRGYSKEKVKSELQGAGWMESVIESTIGMHHAEFVPAESIIDEEEMESDQSQF